MANLGILAKLGVDSTSLKAGLVSAKKSVADFAKSAGGMLLGLAGAAGFGAVIRSAISFGSTMSDLADRTGTTVEEFGALRDIARDAGVQQSVLERGLRNVALRAQEAVDGNKDYGEALERLGINAKKFVGLSTADKFEAIAIAVNDAKNKSQAFADSAKILGEKAGPQLTEVLRRLKSEGLDEIKKGLMESGAIMDGETAAALDGLEDDLQRFKDTVVITSGKLLTKMMPTLKSVAGTIGNLFKAIAPTVIVLSKLAAIVLVVKGTMMAATVAAKAYAAVQLLLTNGLKKARAAMIAFNAAMRANPIGAAIAVILAAVAAYKLFFGGMSKTEKAANALKDEIESLKDEQEKYKQETEETKSRVDALRKSMQELRKEYEQADMTNPEIIEQNTKELKQNNSKIDTLKKQIKEQQKLAAEAKITQQVANEAAIALLRAGEGRDEKAVIMNSKAYLRSVRDSENATIDLNKAEAAHVALVEELTELQKENLILGQKTETLKKEHAADTAEANEKSIKSQKELESILQDINKEHKLSKDAQAKLADDAEKLPELMKEQARLAMLVKEGHKLTVSESEQLIARQKEILRIQGAMAGEAKRLADIESQRVKDLQNDLKVARQDELNMVRNLVGELRNAANEEERKAKAAKDAAQAKEKEVADLRKELAGAEKGLDPFRKFFAVDPNLRGGGGGVRANTAAMAREFRKLRREGDLPEILDAEGKGTGKRVRTLREFQEHIIAQAKAAKKQRDDIVARGKAAKAEAAKLRADQKAHEEKLAGIKEKVQKKERAILKMREKLQDKELRNLKELRKARKDLENVLKQAEKGVNVVVRGQQFGKPAAGQVVAVNVPKPVVTVQGDNNFRDDIASEATARRTAEALEGKFVNQ